MPALVSGACEQRLLLRQVATSFQTVAAYACAASGWNFLANSEHAELPSGVYNDNVAARKGCVAFMENAGTGAGAGLSVPSFGVGLEVPSASSSRLLRPLSMRKHFRQNFYCNNSPEYPR